MDPGNRNKVIDQLFGCVVLVDTFIGQQNIMSSLYSWLYCRKRGPIYTDLGIRFNKCFDIMTSHILKQG